jgi:peroxiredoxin
MTTAPELQITDWFNTETKPSLQAQRGKVVVLHAFQMLCPGCVAHALPQMSRLHRLVDPAQVAVIGLHSVFEHHDVMTPRALEAFIHEYRLGFPIGVDAPSPDGDIPLTMRAYGFQGTPSLVLIDREGRIRLHEFGQVDDLALGMAIGQLVAKPFLATGVDAAGAAP